MRAVLAPGESPESSSSCAIEIGYEIGSKPDAHSKLSMDARSELSCARRVVHSCTGMLVAGAGQREAVNLWSHVLCKHELHA